MKNKKIILDGISDTEVEAAMMFQKLPIDKQDEIIEMLKQLVSERVKEI